MSLRHALLATLSLALALPAAARAEKDWFASLYTNEGTELRADERIFVLYALLNAMGYDDAPVVRRFPVPERTLHPVRSELRRAISLDPAFVRALDAFFDAHPEPVEAYARYALTLQGPGGFEATPASPASLKGLEALLAQAYAGQKFEAHFARVQPEYRSALRDYHAVVDPVVLEVRRLLKVKEEEAPRVVLVVNLLDGQGKAVAGTVGEELFVVVGPSSEPDLYSVALEIARARLAPIVSPKATASKALPHVAAAAGSESAAAFATECYARAFAAAALKLGPGRVEQLSARGYRAVAELAGLVPGFAAAEMGLEGFVAENFWLLAKESPARPAPAGSAN